MANINDAETPPAPEDVPTKEGFAAAASIISFDLDGEAFIFNKFDDLGARNLLYLQCEVMVIRKKLEAFDKEVAKFDADMDLKEAARTWEVLQEQYQNGRADALKQMELIMDLRGKIKEYRPFCSY